MKLRGLIPNFYILVSVSDLYIHRIGLPIWLQQNRQTLQLKHALLNSYSYICFAHRYMNVELGDIT